MGSTGVNMLAAMWVWAARPGGVAGKHVGRDVGSVGLGRVIPEVTLGNTRN